MSRWYVAAAFPRQEEMLGVRKTLLDAGEEVQARWITEHTDMTLHETDEERARDAIRDLEDITKSDGVIFFADPPKAKNKVTGGRHVEFGIGLAFNKRMVIVGTRENVFHYLPSVELYSDFDAFMEEGLI